MARIGASVGQIIVRSYMRLTRLKLVGIAYGAVTLVFRLTNWRDPDDVVFLNWGYEEDPAMNIPLDASDEPDRYGIQLYHRTATQADLTGKQVLEVGCGHGGGASYLMRTLRPATYTGLDLNGAGIKLCRKRHKVPGLRFMKGDAEKLPFPDDCFDAVINVESSHCYPHLPRFFAEVARVLRPGGHFLYADLRHAPDIPTWQAAIVDAPLQLLSERSIDAEVLRGLERNSPQQTNMVRRHVPPIPFARRWGRSIFGVEGGAFHRSLQEGRISYKMFCLEKP